MRENFLVNFRVSAKLNLREIVQEVLNREIKAKSKTLSYKTSTEERVYNTIKLFSNIFLLEYFVLNINL